MKVAFHSSYLGYRGTEIALMDYASGNSTFLGNESFFLMPRREGAEKHPVAGRMREIAPLRFYRNPEEREGILREENADFLYCIKNGFNDGVFSKQVPTGIHAIFRESEFHGDIFAYVSPWLSEVMAYGKAPWVPHMAALSDETADLKADLGIPPEVTVFGRHGGDDSFDISWVQKIVVEIARKNPDAWFLFMNTRQFLGSQNLPNIRFLPPTADAVTKRKFLNSCDAMLHGRLRGETFGLSCLEFAMLGKPVLTYAGSPERAHLEILGDAAVAYRNARELGEFLRHPSSVIRPHAMNRGQRAEDGGRRSEAERQPTTDNRPPSSPVRPWNEKLKEYQPETVMRKFEQVFLK